MTTAFKPGDRVRYNKTDVSPSMKGWEGEVVETTNPSGSGTWVRCLKPGGHTHKVGAKGLYMTSNLELIPPAAFKVGDKVRVISLNGNRTKPPVGLEGVIERQTLTGYWRLNFGHVSPSTHLFYSQELELIEEKEEPEVTEALKVGDKVVVDLRSPHSSWHKVEGVVIEERPYKDSAKVRVTNPGPNSSGYIKVGYEGTLVNLTKIEPTPEPKPFSFEDIQEGDTIRRTKVYRSGATEVREGVARIKGDYYWADKTGNFILAYDGQHEHSEGVVYELLERPEPPKKPEIWENRSPGDKIVAYEPDGKLDRIFIKQENGLWSTLVNTSSGKIGRGFSRADQDIAEFLTKQSVTASLVRA